MRHTNPQGGGNSAGAAGAECKGQQLCGRPVVLFGKRKACSFPAAAAAGGVDQEAWHAQLRTSGDTWPRPGGVACAANLRQIYVASTHRNKQQQIK